MVATGLAAQGGLGKIGGKFDFHRAGFSWVHSKESGNESGEEGVGLEPEPKLFGFGDLARVGGELEDLFTAAGAFEVDDGEIAFLGGAGREGMEVGHGLGEAGEGGGDIGIGDGFGRFLGNLEAFRSGQFKFRGEIDAEDKFELFVFFEISFFDGGIVDEVKLFGFDRMAEAVAEKIFAEFFFDIVGVAAANHFERGVAWAEAGEAGRFLEGKENTFFFFTNLIGWNLALHATAAPTHIFQRDLHMQS